MESVQREHREQQRLYTNERTHLIELYKTELAVLRGRHQDECDRLAVALREKPSSRRASTGLDKTSWGWLSAMHVRDHVQLHITLSDAVEDLERKCSLPARMKTEQSQTYPL